MAPHSSLLAWKIPWTEEPVGYSPRGREKSDMAEQLHFHFSLSCTGEGNGSPLQCSCLENPRDGVAQSQTRLKWLSSSSSRMEQLTGSWLNKECGKAVYCHLSYLTYTQSASFERLVELQTGIKISGRNINNLRYADDTTLMAESEKELKSLLIRVKEESEKASIKLNIKETKIMASGPITSWQIERENVEAVTDFLFLGSSLWIVTAAMKLGQLLLGQKAISNLDSVLKSRHHFANKSP